MASSTEAIRILLLVYIQLVMLHIISQLVVLWQSIYEPISGRFMNVMLRQFVYICSGFGCNNKPATQNLVSCIKIAEKITV